MNENEEQSAGQEPEGQPVEPKARRPRKASNYALQQYREVHMHDTDKNVSVWVEVKDGFAGPKMALAYATKMRLEGVFRVSRTISASYAFTLTRPEPVLTVEKVKVR